MPPTNHLRFRAVLFGGLAMVISCFLPKVVAAQPDLRIENLSVYSTLPESGGFRRVSISFSVVNRGRDAAGPSTTRVIVDNSGASFATPNLNPGAKAYTSRPLRTSATALAITVVADAFSNLSGEDKSNNEVRQTVNLRSDANRWISIGPSKITDVSKIFGPTFGVGRVTTIAVDPRTPLTVYVGARGSGIWKRAGSLWFPIGDALPSQQIDAIGIYPRAPDRLVIATPMGVFESIDAGEVWTQLNSTDLGGIGSGGGALLIENSDDPALYLSTKTGLMVSTDNGRNWKTVLPLDSRIVSLQFSTSERGHLLASTADPPRIFEGKDRGLNSASWRPLLGCVTRLPVFPPGAKVWIAESNRQRWVSIRDTATKKLELWRTTNRICQINGFTEHAWEKVPLRGSACANSQNQFSYLFAHPTDPNILFKGGISLCRSEDRGNTTRTASQIHLDHHAIAVSVSEPEIMFFGTDGGIYRSPNKGKTMEFFSEGLNNTEFLKIDTDGKPPQIVAGGSQDQFTATWNGTSPIWNLVSGGDVTISDSSLVAFDQADRIGIFEIGQSTRQVRLLKPGGGEARLGDSSLQDCVTYSEFPKILESMVSTGTSPRLLISCGGIWAGPPWTQLQPRSPNGPAGKVKRLKLHPSGQLVAATDTGHIFFGRLKPVPSLAEVFQTAAPASPSSITFASQGLFYVSMNSVTGASIHRLECDGAGCKHERVPLDRSFPARAEITALTVDPFDPNALVAAVRNRGVFRGTRVLPDNWTWATYNNGLPFAVTVTDLQPQSNGGIIAATFGRGAFQLFSRIQEPPPQNQVARGRITNYENERVNPGSPPGPNNPVFETIELDSKPGFLFTATSPRGRFALTARRAIQTKRIVTIEFKPRGSQSGTIISLR